MRFFFSALRALDVSVSGLGVSPKPLNPKTLCFQVWRWGSGPSRKADGLRHPEPVL